jgi:hypothetical protein
MTQLQLFGVPGKMVISKISCHVDFFQNWNGVNLKYSKKGARVTNVHFTAK